MCHRLRQRHGDLVWKVRFRDDWLYLLLLLEFQSTIEPAMREMLAVTSAIAGAGMIADGRFSGGSHGIVVGNMASAAQAGGPIAAVEVGDIITIDLEARTIDVDLAPAALQSRLNALPHRQLPYRRGALGSTWRSRRTWRCGRGCA